MIKEAIIKIVGKGDLTYDEAYTVMNEIMEGRTTQVQNAAFLAALSTKNATFETIDEITGCATAMREHATPVVHPYKSLEIVGTGSDGANTFNISTTSSFVVCAGEVKVSKHGNRAASSRSGAADCLEALGINLDQPPEKAARLLDDPGMCFLFAQKYHASMKYVGSIRKELGIRTVFNILGPLTNPAHPTYNIIGVYDKRLIETLAHVMHNMGAERGFIVHGNDRMDEVSCSSSTTVCEFGDGRYDTYDIAPEDFGITRCQKSDVVGGDPADNARITLEVLNGARGPRRDIVLLNSGISLYSAGKASSIKDGVELAAKLIDDGSALAKLESLKVASNL